MARTKCSSFQNYKIFPIDAAPFQFYVCRHMEKYRGSRAMLV